MLIGVIFIILEETFNTDFMDIIGKAFNPSAGDARAVCSQYGKWIMALITKGADSDKTIADFNSAVAALGDDEWDAGQEVWKQIATDSPVLMLCRNTSSNESYAWRKVYYNKLDEVIGPYPEEPYALKSSMMGFYTDMILVRQEVMNPSDYLRDNKFNFYSGKDFVILSTASYDRAKDWNSYNRASINLVTALCGDNPEEHWEDAEKALRASIAQDAAYVVIVDADECRKRAFWNVPEGEPSEHKIRIEWSKTGWELTGPEYDEHISDLIQAKTGVLDYEYFWSLCITEIGESSMTFRYKDKKYVLAPGESFELFENDSYEDSQEVEHYDIDYTIKISWINNE